MSVHRARTTWALADGEDFAKGRYSRGHTLGFDDGTQVAGTASPDVVGAQWAVKGAVDPEAALVSALSSCHMLTFLHMARQANLTVTAYDDEAEGLLEKNADGRLAVTRVTLRPRIVWGGAAPDARTLAHLHHLAHETCFIANSVKTEVTVAEPAP